jgi:DNA-binding cell septation regulator SpoVG
VLDGFALRVTRDGRPYVVIPKRRDSEGRLHAWFLPVDQRNRDELEDAILGAIDLEALTR